MLRILAIIIAGVVVDMLRDFSAVHAVNGYEVGGSHENKQ